MRINSCTSMPAETSRKKFRFFLSCLRQRPTWCSWQITDICNFRCKFCSIWRRTPGDEQSLEQIAASAERLAEIGTMIVSMTGGEPLVRKDLPEIIATVNKHHFTFISTNGSLVTREKARAMAAAGLWGIGVSIDYDDELLHDSARGIAGAYRKAMNALEILMSERINNRPHVNIMVTLMHDNLLHVEKLAKRAREIGCSFRVQPYSTLKTGDTKLIQQHKVVRQLLDLHARYPNFVSSRPVIEKFDQAITEGVPGCVAGRYMINIDPRGYVSKCPENQATPVGHILNDNFPTLLARLREEHRTNQCRACWYNCRNEIEMAYTAKGLFYQLQEKIFGRRRRLSDRISAS